MEIFWVGGVKTLIKFFEHVDPFNFCLCIELDASKRLKAWCQDCVNCENLKDFRRKLLCIRHLCLDIVHKVPASLMDLSLLSKKKDKVVIRESPYLNW